MSDAPDAELIRAHLAGDVRAFEALVARHRTRVYAVALRVCGRPEDALDVCQEVFITAFRKLGTFRQEALLSTWLHRLTVNAALDLARRRSRRDHPSLDVLEARPDPAAGPEEIAMASHRAVAVQAALAKLGPDHRAVVVLHDLNDLDYAGVAEALDIPVGTVKSRLHRARVELARLLKHLEPEVGGTSSKVRSHDD